MPTYRVSAMQTQQGQLVMNVYHYATTGALGVGAAVEVADVIRAAYVSEGLAANTSAGWSFDGVELRRVDLADQPSITAAPTAGALSGSAVQDPLPTQIALLVSGTALTVFPRRVRTYIGGMVESLLTAGLWTVALGDIAIDFIEAIDAFAVTGDTLERVAVRYGDLGDGPVVTASNRIASYSVTRVPATQRRRRLGVGA